MKRRRCGALLGVLLALPVAAQGEAATAFRSSGGQLGIRLTGAVAPAGIRVMVDEDGPARGWTEWGVDRMSEGASVYRYPDGAREWSWEADGSVVFATRGSDAALLLPNVAPAGEFRWYVEWYDSAWRVTNRLPAAGVFTNRADELPAAPGWFEPTMPDIAELQRHAPVTLSRRAARDVIEGDWAPVSPVPPLPVLQAPGHAEPFRLAIEWTDARSGAVARLTPDGAARSGDRVRWHGSTGDGADWYLTSATAADGALEVVVVVTAAVERCFRLTLVGELPQGEWTWHDDVQFSEPLVPGRMAAHDGPSPYGLTQRRSLYPFGVVADDAAVIVGETDLREPRHVLIEATGDGPALRLHYDLAVTPGTGHFPGLAAVRASFRAHAPDANPFRVALRSMYARDPAWTESRVPIHGLWLPFTDVASISNAADFQFAFFEKVGPHGSDLDAARAGGLLTLIYTEPWLYWLPLATTAEWNRASAIQRMEERVRGSVGKDREFASGGLLGATRDVEQQIRMQFLATPWSTGARMEVATDPELPVTPERPVNRAMAEWRFIRESLEDPRVDGIYLDSMSAMETIDYNPAAIAVADHPCTFVLADLKPGLAMPIQAVEFTAALAGYLRERGQYLMANFPCWRFPFFMPYIDIPGEETTWYSGTQYVPMPERERNYRRAISGAKPFGFLQATHFVDLTPDDMAKYLRDCLALGLLPSFFSHDGANDPYWVDASLYERDRALLKTYLPITIALSSAGWQPVPAVEEIPAGVLIEQFGPSTGDVVWLTLRNPGVAPVSGSVEVRTDGSERIVYEVMSGALTRGGGPVEFDLEPGAVIVWMLAQPVAIERQAEWFRRYAGHAAQYFAAAENLESYAREDARGLRFRLAAAPRTSSAEPVVVSLAGSRAGAVDAEFVRWVPDAPERSSTSLPETGSVLIPGPATLSQGEAGWVSAAWEVRVDGATETFSRMIRPGVRRSLSFEGPEGRITATGDVMSLRFSASNRGESPASVVLSWAGDVPQDATNLTVAPGRRLEHDVTLAATSAPTLRVSFRWEVDGIAEHRHDVFLVCAPPLRHLGTRPGVRVTADSAYSGYVTAPLFDGVVETAGLMWYDAAFASAETADPHWIRFLFPEPAPVAAVIAHWNEEGGARFASRQGSLWGLEPDGEWRELGSFEGASTGRTTRIEFPRRMVNGIEWRQPSAGGSEARPNLLWLVELEIE